MKVPPFLQPWIYQVNSGWDPVSLDYAARYGAAEWGKTDSIRATLDLIENWIGQFQGKRVLDLGGGAGQFSVAMALRGAQVTWHDPSRSYRKIAQARARQAGVELIYSLGYLEEAAQLLTEPFDFVFNRICWYYCINDRKFARLVWSLVAAGGSAYLDVTNDSATKSSLRKLASWLNRHAGFKIVHIHPPPGRVAQLFKELGAAKLQVSHPRSDQEILLWTKAGPQGRTVSH